VQRRAVNCMELHSDRAVRTRSERNGERNVCESFDEKCTCRPDNPKKKTKQKSRPSVLLKDHQTDRLIGFGERFADSG